MQTTVDEMGNEIVVVTKNKAPKKKTQKQGDGRVNDNQIATQVIEQWQAIGIPGWPVLVIYRRSWLGGLHQSAHQPGE